MKTQKLNKHDLFNSILKIRLENSIEFLKTSEELYNNNLDNIDDELSLEFYKGLNALDFTKEYGMIATYSLYDFFLTSYCKRIEEIKSSLLSDFKGKNENIKRAKFVNANMEIDIRTFSEYHKIENFRKIRNLLIHNNFNLEVGKSKSQIEEYKQIVSESSYLEFDEESGKIFITSIDYVIDFKNQVLSLFKVLIQRIKSA